MVEASGIPTVAVYIEAFRHHAVNMKVPRAVITRNPLGRTVGAPFDAERQLEVVRAAVGLLESASANGAILDLNDPYRLGAGRRSQHGPQRASRQSRLQRPGMSTIS